MDEIKKKDNIIIEIPNITVFAKFDSDKNIIIKKTNFLKDFNFINDEYKSILNDCIYYYALNFSKCFLTIDGICYTTTLNSKHIIFGEKFLINNFAICLSDT